VPSCHSITQTLCSLNCWYGSFMHKHPFPNSCFSFPFQYKDAQFSAGAPHSHPICLLVLPPNITHILLLILKVSHWNSPFQMSSPFFVLHVVPKNLSKTEASLILRDLFLWRRGAFSPCPSSKMEDHLLSAVRKRSFKIFAVTLQSG
jgi:hypothetical protein